jgi:hypothetical protein
LDQINKKNEERLKLLEKYNLETFKNEGRVNNPSTLDFKKS